MGANCGSRCSNGKLERGKDGFVLDTSFRDDGSPRMIQNGKSGGSRPITIQSAMSSPMQMRQSPLQQLQSPLEQLLHLRDQFCTPHVASVAILVIGVVVLASLSSIFFIAVWTGSTSTTTTTVTSTTTHTTTITTTTVTTVTTLSSLTFIPTAAAPVLPGASIAAVASVPVPAAGMAPVQTTATPATAPPLTAVSMSMRLHNLDYSSLTADDDLFTDFKSRVRGAILSAVGNGIPPENVLLDIREGSVVVVATIKSLSNDLALAVHQGLNASREIVSKRVLASVNTMKGLDVATTGVLAISDMAVVAPGESPSGNGSGFSIPSGVIYVLVFFVIVGLLGVGFVMLRRKRQHKVDPNRTEKEAMLPKAAPAKPQGGGARKPQPDRSKEKAPDDDQVEAQRGKQRANGKSDAREVREFIITAADMGFNEDQARSALKEADSNCDDALDLLLAAQ